MPTLLDTSILVGVERGRIEVPPEVAGETDYALSVVTVVELALSAERAADERVRARRRVFLDRVQADYAVLDVTTLVALVAARAWAALLQRGRPIPAFDLLIAATALAHGLRLFTADAHFGRVEGLRVLTP